MEENKIVEVEETTEKAEKKSIKDRLADLKESKVGKTIGTAAKVAVGFGLGLLAMAAKDSHDTNKYLASLEEASAADSEDSNS